VAEGRALSDERAIPAVSFVIPAFNAAETLAETLASIQAQTFGDWEAVIVDDGSSDASPSIAAEWAARDPRFRPLRQANAGHSAARNTGIAAARGAWLAFLDSDDWVAPEFLELNTRALAADPALDIVVCGCVHVFPSGEHGPPAVYEAGCLDDAFPAFVLDCPIAIHNCLVRRSIVQAVGGFDTSLKVGEDWDLWQRVARTSPRFGTVREVLAFYRMRPGTASTKANHALVDGWTVMRRGHARDPRVPSPVEQYAEGLSPDGLPLVLYRQAVWAASLELAHGKDARALIPLMGEQRAPMLDGERVAQWLFEYVPVAASKRGEDWPALWPLIGDRLRAYVAALESQAGAPGLAADCERALARLLGAPPPTARDQAAATSSQDRPSGLRARIGGMLSRVLGR
jgi:hypothetical protein